MKKSPTVFPVIMDIVDSRKLINRNAAQTAIELACAQIDTYAPAIQQWHATVGDEFQAIYASLHEALQATGLLRLALPSEVDCRFGIGAGNIAAVSSVSVADIQDGSGWWSARTAIEEARQREKAKTPELRSWFHPSAEPSEEPIDAALTNAYLLARDHLISSLNPKTKRYVSGLSRGLTQAAVAISEGVTQSAVSQAVKNAGAGALIASLELLDPRT